MKKITYPLRLRMQGAAVTNLQEALQLLLSRVLIPVQNEDERKKFSESLKIERERRYYGKTTKQLVSIFQKERRLEASGEVDKPTADALNTLLEELGVFDESTVSDGRNFAADTRFTVQCRAVDARGKPIAGLRIEAFDQDPMSPDDPLGEPAISDAEGQVVFRFRLLDFSEHPDEGGPDLYFKVYRNETLLSYTLPNIRNDKGVIRGFQPQRRPVTLRIEKHYVVTGKIRQENGLPADKLSLFVHHLAFGGHSPLLGSPVTDAQGHYLLAYDPGSGPVNLEIRIKDPKDTQKQVPLMRPRFAAAPYEVLNLVVPNAPMEAEYRRLSNDLKAHIGQMTKLRSVKEGSGQHDITVLNRATGWDARLIALATITERLKADPEVNLQQEGLYGLLRAGLPSDKLLLAQVEPEVIVKALEKVRGVGIIALTDPAIKEFKEAFTSFRNEIRLNISIPGSRTTVGELLDLSGLPNDKKLTFAQEFLKHRGTGAELWEKVSDAGLNDDEISILKRQGKFSFLAANSAGMTEWLMNKQVDGPAPTDKQVVDPVQLVDQGLYTADKWKNEVFDHAGIPDIRWNNLTDADKAKLDLLIPAKYATEKVEDRLTIYAEDMARKMRLSYPTQVLVKQMETDEKFNSLVDTDTVSLLRNAANQGFRLGETSVTEFFKNNPVQKGIVAGPVAQQQLQALQRFYQIAPTNEAMPVLAALNMTSAYDVVAFSKDEFAVLYSNKYSEIYEGKIPTTVEVDLIYRKATQVSTITYNLFTIAKKMESEPPVAGLSAPAAVRDHVRGELIKRFPTMESLFGSMDFCECEHCRSVLSPAAYLVDLLQFIDPEPEVWGNFQAHWKATHGDQDYPNEKPYDVLIERRPDLPHIPLTCENTHTALPYIDIVNEILEYYVANGKLEEKAAHDTGEATTAELLAEPQHVIREAYDKLREARYPLNLPFDLWIETVRQFCNYFETPLADVLEVFRPSDDLIASTQSFDRATIFIESLGFSPGEAAIFTDPDPLKNYKWHQLYGLPIAKPSIQNSINIDQAKLSVPNVDAQKFREGLACTYFDVSTNALSTESKIISAIGTSGSGGAGITEITFEDTWVNPPVAGDFLVCAAPEMLKSAKTLSRRLGISYKEITEIVQTGFVNPKLTELVLLYKLGVSVQDARVFKEHIGFYEQNKDLIGKDRKLLSDEDKLRYDTLSNVKDLKSGKTGWDVVNEIATFLHKLEILSEEFNTDVDDLQIHIKNISFGDILLLADSDTGCSFDLTTLQYANGDPAQPIDFLRINLFVRLWRKLGWSIEETDRALCTFTPELAPFNDNLVNLAQQPLKTALIYFAHLKTLCEKLKLGKQSYLKLLTLWSDIATTGKHPLYAQLFLTRRVRKSGEIDVIDDGQNRRISVFDDPFGQYLKPAKLAKIADQVKYEVFQQNIADANKINAAAFAGEKRLTLYYDSLNEAQYLTYLGALSDEEKVRLTAISPSELLETLLTDVQAKAKEFTLIKGHLLALQGALGLTANEIKGILEEAGDSIDSAGLSLPNISFLYRYGLLAKALKLSVKELITIKQISGFDPLKPIYSGPLTVIEEDHPFSQTLHFVNIVDKIKDSGLKIEDLDFLLRHRFDEMGTYRPNREGILALLKILGDGVNAIRREHQIPTDSGTLSQELLQQKLGLILLPDVAATFLSMMDGTVEFTATQTGVEPADKLIPDAFKDERSIRQLIYNETRKEQKLTFRGVLFDLQKNDLKGHLPKPPPNNPHVPSPVFEALLDDVQGQAQLFFDKYLLRQANGVQPASGFLDAADFDLLFEPMPAGLTDTERQEQVRQQRSRLAQSFFSYLQDRLSRQFIVQTLIAHTNADPVLVESLISNERLLGNPEALINAFAAIAEVGINAAFFDSSDGSGMPQATTAMTTSADTALKDKTDVNGRELNPANSARFEGYLEVPTPGAYRFYAELENPAIEAVLRFPHLSEPVLLKPGPGKTDEFLELKTGVLYEFSFDLDNLNGGAARLLVQSETLPKGSLSQLRLYPATAIAGAEQASVLLSKALQLVQSLGLSEREIRYLLTQAADFDGLNLSELPTQSVGNTPAEKTATARQFLRFLRLAGYAKLKSNLADGTDDLINIFEANGTTELDKLDEKVYPLIAKLTRRDEATIKATAKALFVQPAFESEKPLQRLWEALQVVERFGVPVASLLEWTRIINATTLPEQRSEIASGLKEAIKARFDPETWLRVAQPIFDKLRQRQRDSLVSFLIYQLGFDRLEQLYEYFLIDPGMEPVVQTSRIRLAISTVRLFIQRCLLNLELKVNPAIINTKHWEWMKRYRVWEANRKIFLFPENWLEPEFRDDKTHLFNELEGALLQGDVSNDLVEDAFLNYLKKLDELARLNIVAMHIEDNFDPAGRVLHVFGRTYSHPHKYFYRRFAHQMWTPWEPMSAEIEGDHLAPVVWRDRLYLFWVTFMDKADPDAKPSKMTQANNEEPKFNQLKMSEVISSISNTVATKVVEVQLHWSEYLQGEWRTRESSGFKNVIVKKAISKDFNPSEVFMHVNKAYENGEERGVYIHLDGKINNAFLWTGRNSTAEITDYGATIKNPTGYKPRNPFNINEGMANRYLSKSDDNHSLDVTFRQRIKSGYYANQIMFWRLLNPKIGDHFYTTSETERDNAIKQSGYKDEGSICMVLPSGSENGIPLYRLWNPTIGDHFYTTSETERDKAIKQSGYKDQGSTCMVLPLGSKDGIPLYRLWNPKIGDHFYTTSETERDNAVSNYDYKKEGVACRVILREEKIGVRNLLADLPPIFSLLPCDNNLTTLGLSEDAFKNASNPVAVAASIESGLSEIAELIKPVFLQDNRHTFFVEPSVTEKTVEEWEEWVHTHEPGDTGNGEPLPGWWGDLVVIPRKPWDKPTLDLDALRKLQDGYLDVDPGSLLAEQKGLDWLINPGTLFQFDDYLIGSTGPMDVEVVTGDTVNGVKTGQLMVNVNPGSTLERGSTVLLNQALTTDQAVLVQTSGGINIIGNQGYNSVLAQNQNQFNNNLGPGLSGR